MDKMPKDSGMADQSMAGADKTLPQKLDDDVLAEVSGGVSGQVPGAPPKPVTTVPGQTAGYRSWWASW